MGTSADINGISLQFVNELNEPIEAPIHGRFAHIRGVDRSEALKYTTLAPGEEPGSEHWMTLVAVADTQERLDAIVGTATARKGSVNTSAASHRVLVAYHVGDTLRSVENRSVIASGPIVKMDPPEVNVVHVKVLPENAFASGAQPPEGGSETVPLRKGPQQIAKEFRGMSPLSATGVKEAAKSLIAQETKAAAAAAAAAAANAAPTATPPAAAGDNPYAAPGAWSPTK
jgi:hypothetical protein